MTKIFAVVLTFFLVNITSSQTTINQNGLQTTVIGSLSAQNTQAKRYEIANIGYNSYHWQHGGLIIVEIYQTYFSTDYQKYVIQNSFGEGINSGSPVIKLAESHGNQALGKIILGIPTDITSYLGDHINKQLPIFFDVQNYAVYNIKITYTQTKVDVLTAHNQIKINEAPTSINISNFTVSNELGNNFISTGLLRLSSSGNHYIQNGNLGIGTTAPDEKLTVKGKIHTQEVMVDMSGPLVPDYVFSNNYKLKSLQEVDDYIKKNSHLPEIPSAKEIEKNGLMLAEMNMSLLKKIEELTLYMIEMKKENEKIISENMTMKKNQIALEERIEKIEKNQ